MFLKKLSLTNYKNLEASQFKFEARINCFIGNNGIGKSNILDGIYHLAFTKSYFNPSSVQNIQFNKEFFVIEGEFEKLGRDEKINCSLKRGQKKVIKRNGKVYDKIAEHIGLIPLVIISPADQDLIIEGSMTRRKFIDSVIGQTDKNYLQNLLDYKKTLAQRNALLKYFALNRTFDKNTLDIYNHQMNELSRPIFDERVAFMEEFIPIFKSRYKSISGDKEKIDIEFKSDLNENTLLQLLEQHLDKDRMLQFTSVGVHKDDLDFQISGSPIKKFGSQGQQKTFLIALKLAQFDFIKQVAGMSPIVLLDDIFDKLDQNRVAQTIQLFENETAGQIFISDTHGDRIKEALSAGKSSYELFNLN
jgi:DNA replication and repair protein RecF